MTNDFMVTTAEILLLDEQGFLASGGETLTFGVLDGTTVRLHAEGSAAAIRGLARGIIAHHTAAW